MGRVIGLLLVVVGIWVGIEVYTNGTQNALGGIFASESEQAVRDPRSVPQRAGDAVERANALAEERLEHMLPE